MARLILLAPVPIEHLEAGQGICHTKSKVAFGSRAWKVFRQIDAARNGEPITSYIYASGSQVSQEPEVSWEGRFIRWIEAVDGTHPDGMTFRPDSTNQYPLDNKGHWIGFWELDELRCLTPAERIPISHFKGYKSNKNYKSNFVPKGPIIVTH